VRVTRRALVAAGALLPLAARAAGAPDFGADPIRLLRRVRYAGDERPFFWWMAGTRYGQVDNRLEPLFDMAILSVMRVKGTDPDRFAVTSLELVAPLDLAGGAALVRWRNPYTGAELTPTPRPVGPLTTVYSPDGREPPAQLPGSRIEMRKPPYRVLATDGDVFVRDDSFAEAIALDGKSPPYPVGDLAEYHARRRDLETDAARFVPATVAFTAVTGWQRWMGMAGRPGGSVARAMGRKVQRLGEVPDRVLAPLRATFADVMADPVAALDRPPYRFER